jgi:hypothetical protein
MLVAVPTPGAAAAVAADAEIVPNEGGASVWYKWTVPVTGSYQFDTCTANPDLPATIGALPS